MSHQKNRKNYNLVDYDLSWIALYLSGQYPGYYCIPDRLNFFEELQLENPTKYNYTVLGQYQGKTDYEFFHNLLNSFKKNNPDRFENLLYNLGVPDEVRVSLREKKKEKSKKNDIQNYSKLVYKEYIKKI